MLQAYGGGGEPGRIGADVIEQLRLAAEPAVEKGRGYTRKLRTNKFAHNSRRVEGGVDPDPVPAMARAELVPDPDPAPLEVVQPDLALLPAGLEVAPGPELVAVVPQDEAPVLAGPEEVPDQEQEGAAALAPALAPARADDTTAEEIVAEDPVPDQEQDGAAALAPGLAPARADNTTAEGVMVADSVPDPAPLYVNPEEVRAGKIAEYVLEVLDIRRQLRAFRDLGQRAKEMLK